MNELSLYFFRSMQLASFLSGFFMVLVSVTDLMSARRGETLAQPRWYFALMGFLFGTASLFAFAPRLLDHLVVWLHPPLGLAGPAAVTALVLLYGVSGSLFALLSGKPKRTLTVYLLLLSGSLFATYLEAATP
jgi:uncharacterized membrane protein